MALALLCLQDQVPGEPIYLYWFSANFRPPAVLVETRLIRFIARSMLMPFSSAYAYARSSVSFSAMTR